MSHTAGVLVRLGWQHAIIERVSSLPLLIKLCACHILISDHRWQQTRYILTVCTSMPCLCVWVCAASATDAAAVARTYVYICVFV
jgi:hypothetical protein